MHRVQTAGEIPRTIEQQGGPQGQPLQVNDPPPLQAGNQLNLPGPVLPPPAAGMEPVEGHGVVIREITDGKAPARLETVTTTPGRECARMCLWNMGIFGASQITGIGLTVAVVKMVEEIEDAYGTKAAMCVAFSMLALLVVLGGKAIYNGMKNIFRSENPVLNGCGAAVIALAPLATCISLSQGIGQGPGRGEGQNDSLALKAAALYLGGFARRLGGRAGAQDFLFNSVAPKADIRKSDGSKLSAEEESQFNKVRMIGSAFMQFSVVVVPTLWAALPAIESAAENLDMSDIEKALLTSQAPALIDEILNAVSQHSALYAFLKYFEYALMPTEAGGVAQLKKNVLDEKSRAAAWRNFKFAEGTRAVAGTASDTASAWMLGSKEPVRRNLLLGARAAVIGAGSIRGWWTNLAKTEKDERIQEFYKRVDSAGVTQKEAREWFYGQAKNLPEHMCIQLRQYITENPDASAYDLRAKYYDFEEQSGITEIFLSRKPDRPLQGGVQGPVADAKGPLADVELAVLSNRGPDSPPPVMLDAKAAEVQEHHRFAQALEVAQSVYPIFELGSQLRRVVAGSVSQDPNRPVSEGVVHLGSVENESTGARFHDVFMAAASHPGKGSNLAVREGYKIVRLTNEEFSSLPPINAVWL